MVHLVECLNVPTTNCNLQTLLFCVHQFIGHYLIPLDGENIFMNKKADLNLEGFYFIHEKVIELEFLFQEQNVTK